MAEKQARILVVEDNAGIRKLLSLQLKLNGYSVIIAKDGQEALEQLKKALPDILLLDLHIPVINGLDILAKLRKDSQIPVLAISAHTEMRQQALELGADYFLAKPFDPEYLIKILKGLSAKNNK